MKKIIIQKMAKLIKRGLVSGCGCGCRGDYEITQKGIEWLSLQYTLTP
jgi:predicted transcriptional regulator